MMKPPQTNGPDPAVHEAVGRLTRTQLSPLEETMYQAWTKANQLDNQDDPLGPDLRQVYQQTGGKVLPPGQLANQVGQQSDIQTLMQAQEAHDAASPIKHMMEALKTKGASGGSPMGAGTMGAGAPGVGAGATSAPPMNEPQTGDGFI